MDEAALYRLCDYILRETKEPLAAFFLSDGTVRLGIGRAANKTKTKFFATPFDPVSAPKKKNQIWQSATQHEFAPRHCIAGKLGDELSMQSEDMDALRSILAAADEAANEYAKRDSWKIEEDRKGWNKLCLVAAEEITAGRIEKLVPARFLQLRGGELIWKNYFSRLRESSGANTHRFIWRMKEEVFFGASPELLLRVDGEKIFVPAIAGTRAYRGDAEAASRELLSSEKEAREHAHVVRDIVETLTALGMKPDAPKNPELLVLKNLVHLFTPIEATLDKGISIFTIAKHLHPTPAMGGFPKKESVKLLGEHENWDRGYYASPLGFVDENGSGAFVVGIRSALFTKDCVTLFAGAGYVRGSSADAEWKETRAKMQSMLGVFEL